MDNLAVMITTAIVSKMDLAGLEKYIKWTGMSFKPVNINITSSHKPGGKVNDKFHFKIGEMSIPTYTKKLVKSRGEKDSTIV